MRIIACCASQSTVVTNCEEKKIHTTCYYLDNHKLEFTQFTLCTWAMEKYTKTSKFKWTLENTISLIELYKSQSCLWMAKHEKYKCREAKNDAWKAVCSPVGCLVEEAKRKMRNLVAQFYRERQKYRKMKKSGAGAHFTSKWFAYEALLFLRDKNKVRHCTEGGLQSDFTVSYTITQLPTLCKIKLYYIFNSQLEIIALHK